MNILVVHAMIILLTYGQPRGQQVNSWLNVLEHLHCSQLSIGIFLSHFYLHICNTAGIVLLFVCRSVCVSVCMQKLKNYRPEIDET